MRNWLLGIIDRLLVVTGALLFSQAPQFLSQYTHRLAGHAEELKLHIRAIQQAAIKSGLELPEYLTKFTSHQDPDISMHGQMMQGMIDRYAQLSQGLTALQDSTPFTRPFAFIQHLNWDIVKATFHSFQPGLLLTMEGAIYAVVGMGLGYVTFRMICGVFSLFGKKIYS